MSSSALEIVPLSQLYAKLKQPLALHDQGAGSHSILQPRKTITIPAPLVQYGPFSCREVADFALSEVAVAYLPNAIVSRTGVVIVEDRYIIQETMEGSAEANGIGAGIDSTTLADCPKSDEIIINCNKLGMWNYSLFLFEVAPSLMLASMIPGLDKFRAKTFFQSFMKQSDIDNRLAVFSLFGIGADRVVLAESDFTRHRGVIVFKFNDLHKSQRLSQLVSPVCGAIMGAFTNQLDNGPRRLYISRQAAPSRKVVNYQALLESVLCPHRVTSIELETLSVAEQVDLFAKADLVIAEHGAGLANIAFMRPGGFVIEMMPSTIATRGVYRFLAAHRQLNYAYTTIPTPPHWRWDKDDLVAPLSQYDFLLSRVNGAASRS